jgi:hypothetical protein
MKLSIFIPIQRDIEAFESTLASVLKWRPNNCDVIVTHDGTYQDPHQLSDEVQFVELKKTSWAAQLSSCVRDCNSDIICNLMPGIEVEDRWYEEVAAHFNNPSVVAVSPQIAIGDLTMLGLTKSWSGQPTICISGNSKGVQSASRFAGFWRVAFLERVLDNFVRSPIKAVDLEMGICAAAAGLETVTTSNKRFISMLSQAQLQSEITLSGYDAQQLMFRHTRAGTLAKASIGILATIAEPLGGLSGIWSALGRTIGMAGLFSNPECPKGVAEICKEFAATQKVANRQPVSKRSYFRAA